MDKQQMEQEIDVYEYIKIILKRRYFILALVFISMLVAGLLSFYQTKKYVASATFFPLQIQEYYSGKGESFYVKSPFDIDNLVISLLDSRKMSDRIIDQLALEKKWNMNLLSDARKALRQCSRINTEKNGLIRVAVITDTPDLSARIANAYVDNLEFFNQELNLGADRQIVKVIDRAVVPDKRMPRGTIKRILTTGFTALVAGIFLTFGWEFFQRDELIKKLKDQ